MGPSFPGLVALNSLSPKRGRHGRWAVFSALVLAFWILSTQRTRKRSSFQSAGVSLLNSFHRCKICKVNSLSPKRRRHGRWAVFNPLVSAYWILSSRRKWRWNLELPSVRLVPYFLAVHSRVAGEETQFFSVKVQAFRLQSEWTVRR